MPGDIGDKIGIGPATVRGREWPCLRQFCVFMENRVGRLHELLQALERSELRVIALSVVDTVDFAVVRLITNDCERAREVLSLNQFTVIENDILGVVLPDDPQPFVSVFVPLVSAELNIHYTYPLLIGRGRRAIALYVDNIDLATQVLREHGHTLLSDNDVAAEDDFF